MRERQSEGVGERRAQFGTRAQQPPLACSSEMVRRKLVVAQRVAGARNGRAAIKLAVKYEFGDVH